MLVIKKALVSIDLMVCQKALAKQITSEKADYLLTVKRNQPELYDETALVFEAYDADMAPRQIFEQEFLDKDHGRIERRIYSLTNEVWNLEAKTNWPGFKCMGRVRSIRGVNGKTSDETRYLIKFTTTAGERFCESSTFSLWQRKQVTVGT